MQSKKAVISIGAAILVTSCVAGFIDYRAQQRYSWTVEDISTMEAVVKMEAHTKRIRMETLELNLQADDSALQLAKLQGNNKAIKSAYAKRDFDAEVLSAEKALNEFGDNIRVLGPDQRVTDAMEKSYDARHVVHICNGVFLIMLACLLFWSVRTVGLIRRQNRTGSPQFL